MRADVHRRSVAELEGVEWPRPGPRVSPTLARCYELRKKPLSELSVSDLRVLIGQDIGLDFLMPLALDVVEREPLIKAEHYRGDLLAVVLRAAPQFYQKNPKMKARVDTVLASLPSALEKLDFIEFDTSSEALEEASLLFRRGTP